MTTRLRSQHRRLLVVALLCGVAGGMPRAAEAQSVPAPSRGVQSWYAPDFNAQFQCGTLNVETTGVGATSGGCAAQGASYSGFAETVAGLARSRAFVAANLLQGSASGNSSWGTGSSAWWRDRLIVTSGAATEMEITLRWTGSVAASVAFGGQGYGPAANASANWTFQAFGAGFARLTPDYGGNASAFARFDVGNSHASVFDDTKTFRFSLLGSSGSLIPFVDLVHATNTGASLYDFLTGPSLSFGGSAVADMSSTGKITGLIFRDAAGVDITSAVTYDFQNGTEIYPNATVLPEPSTVALVGLGLVVIGVGSRRRRVV